MMIPTVHLNGTSKTELVEQNERVFVALQNAYVAMKQASPNGRDFYTKGDSALSRALEEHRERMVRMHTLMDQYEQIIGEIEKQER